MKEVIKENSKLLRNNTSLIFKFIYIQPFVKSCKTSTIN